MFLLPVYSVRRLACPAPIYRSHEEVTPWSQRLAAHRLALRASWISWQQQLQPYLAGISLAIALVSIACASIFVVIAEQDLSPGAIAFNRLLIAGTIFGLWQHWTASSEIGGSAAQTQDVPSFRSNWRVWGLFLLVGASFAGSLGCAAWSLTQTTVANSTLLNNLMPLFTTLGAWLVLGQQFSRRFLLGLGVAIAGVIAIGVQDLSTALEQTTGDAAALLAAIFLAIALLGIERLRRRYSTATTMAGMSLVGAAVLLPVALLSPGSLLPPTGTSGLAVIALALVSQVLGHGLLTYSLKSLSSSLVSVLMLIIPVLSTGLATVLFGQHLSMLNGIAFAIVLSGIYLAISEPDAAAIAK